MRNEPDNRPRVAIVSLARAKGMGEGRRVASLREVFELAGARVFDIRLLTDHRRRGPAWLSLPLWNVLRGRVVPEAMIWNARSAVLALESLDVDFVIVETIRAFHPRFLDGPWTVVLDYVDRLSVSYRDRSEVVQESARQLMFRILAHTSERFERRVRSFGLSTIADGHADAEALSADWVPITQKVLAHERVPLRADCVFFGNLSYPPNVAAVERLARIWPMVCEKRQDSTLLLAGSRMRPDQRALAERLGWFTEPDFASIERLLSGVKMAVVPLDHASGLQIKVLEGAAAGLAQVLSPAAIAGLDDGFPGVVASDDRDFAMRIVELLSDDGYRSGLGRAGQQHIASLYSARHWSHWARDLIGPTSDSDVVTP